MDDLKKDNFDTICRTCLKKSDNLVSISLLNIIDMIKACSSVQIWLLDELPKKLCEICLVQLQNAFNFKQLCEKSDHQLRQILTDDSGINVDEVEVVRKLASSITIKDEKLINDEVKSSTENCSDDKIEVDISSYVLVSAGTDTDSTDNVSTENEEDESHVVLSDAPITPIQIIKKRSERYECEICKHKFGEVWQLGTHMREIHNVPGQKCSRCHFLCYHPLHLEDHEKSHYQKNHFCIICKKGFANKSQLKKHEMVHSDDRPHHCIQCDLSFKARFILTKHIKNVHDTEIVYSVCRVCGNNVRQSYLHEHLKIHEERQPFNCQDCERSYFSAKALEVHIRKIHKRIQFVNRYLCPVCGRRIHSKAEMRRHARSHTGEKPFDCDKCDKKFARTSGLNHHVKTVHLDQRPFACTVCALAFHSKSILKNHMIKHTGERPYTCLACGKSFGFKNVLKTHMKVHSSIENE